MPKHHIAAKDNHELWLGKETSKVRGGHFDLDRGSGFALGIDAQGKLIKVPALISDNWSFNGTSNILTATTPANLVIDCGLEKTLELAQPVWDDMLVNSGIFTFAGAADPTLSNWQPSGAGTTFKVYKFQKNDEVYFSCQFPHVYRQGSDVRAHVHWTPADRGTEEDGNYVGWKLDYSWSNIDGPPFGESATVDMSGTCSGVDDHHQASAALTEIDGTAMEISSMVICKLYRTDTGADDTWVGSTAAQSPALLQFDFHIQVDTQGSRQEWVK